MRPSLLAKPLATAAAFSVIASGVLAISAAPAHAAPIYWGFQNFETGTCLTGGKRDGGTGKAYAAACSGSQSQQWDWLASGLGTYKMLRNRASGLCLATDDESAINAVWTSTCTIQAGRSWRWDPNFSYLESYFEKALRTSPREGAVYTQEYEHRGAFRWDRVY